MKRLLLLGLLMLAAPAHAQSGPSEYSGMARFGDGALLVVSDAKGDSSHPRLGILTLAGKRPALLPVAVDDWKGDPSSDLEACCPVPGTPDEFLLAESGWFKGRFGRIFRVRLAHDPARGWAATVLSSFQPFPMPEGGTTPGEDQVEGMAALPAPGGPLLVLGQRGGPGKPGRLVWGHLGPAGFERRGEREFSLQGLIPEARSCGDLQIVPAGGDAGWDVYSVASTDPGDLGPFRSAVARIGRFRGERPVFEPLEPQVRWELDGLKVESLAPTPAGVEDSPFCIGTDDEVYGGLWRPLPASIQP